MVVGFAKIVRIYMNLFANHICPILVEDLWSSLIEFGSIVPDILRTIRALLP